MIRKMLVIAAAVAMPATALAGITAISGAGIASAKAQPPVTAHCLMTGTVTFNKGGLSPGGFITSKTSTTTKTAITPNATGSDAACPAKGIKNKIASSLITPPGGGAAQTCWATLPSVAGTGKTAYLVPGVLASGAPASCLQGFADVNSMTVKSVKTAVKDPYWSGTTNGLVGTGTSAIAASLAPGIATTDNGTKIRLDIAADGSTVTGGLCPDLATGFFLADTVTNLSTNAVIGSYTLSICLGGDSGTNTSGWFGTDLLSGPANENITAAFLSPDSVIDISIP